MKKMKWVYIVLAVVVAAGAAYGITRYSAAQKQAALAELAAEQEEVTVEPKELESLELLHLTEVYGEIRDERMPAITTSGGGYVWTGGTSVDFAALKALNSDIVAYIYSPGTPINYPVCWTGSDYYLHTNLYHQASEYGAIYIAKENNSNFSNGNTILYGHHMKDRSMFASIDSYKAGNSYYNAHPVMYIYTPTQNYQVNVFAGFSCPHNDEVFATSFTDSQIQSFINRSTFSSGVYPTHNIVTLCTCSYEHDNWRYVLLGDLVPID